MVVGLRECCHTSAGKSQFSADTVGDFTHHVYPVSVATMTRQQCPAKTACTRLVRTSCDPLTCIISF